MKRKSNIVSDQAKVEKRRKRNREAAKKCREKKNAQIAQLEAEKERVIFVRYSLMQEMARLSIACSSACL